MKSSLEAAEKQISEETSAKPQKQAPASVIDTSKMSKGKREALELAEASRDPLDERGSFASNLFIGRYDFNRIYPWPEQSGEDRAAGREFLASLEKYLRENIDADEIDRTGEIPQKNIDDLFAMGAFGVKIPKQYEGLGLSQVNYGRAAMLLGSWDENLTALVSAHQSIGVPQPLLLFGTDEQKKKYLPRVARKEISAFALTEWNAGSDPEHEFARGPDRGRLGVHPKRRKTLVHQFDQSRRARGHGRHPAEDGEWSLAQTNHGLHRRCRFARARNHLSLPVHGIARALQRDCEIHERSGPAREHDREGRAGIEGRAHNLEHWPADDSSRVRRFIETFARDLPQMGERASSMGRSDRATFRNRGENCGNGGEYLRDGSDDVSDFRARRSQSRRP